MTLSPLRFQNATDLNRFINTLLTQDLIAIRHINGRAEINIKSYQAVCKKLLKASNGNVYFLDEVLEYLKQATDKEIEASGVTFFTSEGNPISLAQLKSDSNIYNQLQYSLESVRFFRILNPVFYSHVFSSLNTIDDIKKAKALLGNTSFYSSISLSNSILSLTSSIVSLATTLSSFSGKVYPSPHYIKSSDFTNNFNKDIRKITLIEEIKLKSYLMNEKKKFKNQQELDEINNWIKEIDENISKTKKLFQQLIDIATKQRNVAESAKSEYQQIMTEDPTLEKTKKEREKLNDEVDRATKELESRKTLFKVLKPIAVYGLLVALPILTIPGLLITLAFLAPVAVIPTLVAILIPLMLLSTILTLNTLFSEKLINGFLSIKHSIENLFSLDDKEKQIAEIQVQVSSLQNKMEFASKFSELSPQHLSTEHYTALISALELDLKEITDLESEVNESAGLKIEDKSIDPMKNPLTSLPSVTDVGMFPRNNTTKTDHEQPAKRSELTI